MIKKYINEFKNKVNYNNYISKEIRKKQSKKDKKAKTIFSFFEFFYFLLIFFIINSSLGMFFSTILPEITFFEQKTQKVNPFYINKYFNEKTNTYLLKNKIDINEVKIDNKFLNEFYHYDLKKNNSDINTKTQNNIKFDTFSHYLQKDYIINEISLKKFKEKFYKDNQMYSKYFNFYSWNNDTYFLTNKQGDIVIYQSKNQEKHTLKEYNNDYYNLSFNENMNTYTITKNNSNSYWINFSVFSAYIQDINDLLKLTDFSSAKIIKNNDNNNFSFSYINNNKLFRIYINFNDDLKENFNSSIKKSKKLKKLSINTFFITLTIFLFIFPFYRKFNKYIKEKNQKIKNNIIKNWLLKKQTNNLLLEHKKEYNIPKNNNKQNQNILF